MRLSVPALTRAAGIESPTTQTHIHTITLNMRVTRQIISNKDTLLALETKETGKKCLTAFRNHDLQVSIFIYFI